MQFAKIFRIPSNFALYQIAVVQTRYMKLFNTHFVCFKFDE